MITTHTQKYHTLYPIVTYSIILAFFDDSRIILYVVDDAGAGVAHQRNYKWMAAGSTFSLSLDPAMTRTRQWL